MHLAGSVRAYRREEVLRLEPVCYVVEFLAVAREEDGPGARAVSDAYHVALYVFGAVGGRSEGLVVPAVAGGDVGYGLFVVACLELELRATQCGLMKNVPGSLNNGYGFVVRPMLIIVFSGLS
jgi:hypothetical protein